MALLTNLQKRVAGSRQERGAVLVLTALVMMLLLFIAAFATDLGAWYRQGQEQQRAADVGSLNGMQAYDRAVKDFFTARGVKKWEELSITDQQLAESAGMSEAVATVIGLLETSGLVFTDAGSGSIAKEPTNNNDSSIWTVVATDGTIVTITRTFEETSVGSGVFGRTLRVQVQAPGEQYFSNLLRDAPEINRDASATLSNCDADCAQDITLRPPLQGFTAAGNGDGFSPLVDLKAERVWQINHLFDGTRFGLEWSQVVCMDARAEAQCSDWTPLDKEFYGHFIPDEVLDTSNNRLFYPGMGQSVLPDANGRRVGSCNMNGALEVFSSCEFFIACTSTTANAHCKPTKIGDDYWGGGPWMVGGKLWATSAEGNIFCIDPAQVNTSSPWCPGYPSTGRTTVASGNLTTSNDFRALITGDVLGDDQEKLVIYNAPSNVFYCWDTSTDNNCSGFGLVDAQVDHSGSQRQASRFHQYDGDGNILRWCLSRSGGWVDAGAVQHTCVDDSGSVANNPIPNLVNNQARFLTWNEGFTWVAPDKSTVKMYFSGYAPVNRGMADSGVVNCYDWKTRSMCADIEIDAGDDTDSYTFRAFSRECVIGVGDTAKFFTFSAIDGTPCTSAQVTDTILPCDCNNDSLEKRWGSIALPADFRDVLNQAHVFVLDGGVIIDPETGATTTGRPSATHPVAHDLIAEGQLDLTALNGVHDGPLTLLIVVDAKLDNDGDLLWKEEKSVQYSLVVQPTLTN